MIYWIFRGERSEEGKRKKEKARYLDREYTMVLSFEVLYHDCMPWEISLELNEYLLLPNTLK